MPVFERFSRNYAIVHDAEVRTWSENEAHIDEDLYEIVLELFGGPVVGYIGGRHYDLRPSRQVLSNQVAIPERTRGRDEPDVLMVQK